jgi:hypothetical protein
MKTEHTLSAYFLHPFRYIAGVKSLITGILLLVALVFAGFFTKTALDGVLDMHFLCQDQSMLLKAHWICIFGSWIVSVVVFYITALILTKSKIRLIDLAGTFALAKAPFLLLICTGLIPQVHNCSAKEMKAGNIQEMMAFLQSNMVWMVPMALISILVLVWFIYWFYQAYSVSANLKGNKGIVSFIVALLVSEAVSKILIIWLM